MSARISDSSLVRSTTSVAASAVFTWLEMKPRIRNRATTSSEPSGGSTTRLRTARSPAQRHHPVDHLVDGGGHPDHGPPIEVPHPTEQRQPSGHDLGTGDDGAVLPDLHTLCPPGGGRLDTRPCRGLRMPAARLRHERIPRRHRCQLRGARTGGPPSIFRHESTPRGGVPSSRPRFARTEVPVCAPPPHCRPHPPDRGLTRIAALLKGPCVG